jgi:signal transduction histidine kinase
MSQDGISPKSRDGQDGVIPAWRSWAELLLGAILVPALVLVIVLGFWRDPRAFFPVDQGAQEQGIMEEWFNEARIGQSNLVDLTARLRKEYARDPFGREVADTREDLLEFLDALGVPTSITLNQQIPLFPNIYQVTIEFAEPSIPSVLWNSGLPQAVGTMAKSWLIRLRGDSGAAVRVEGQLRTYQVRKEQEEEERTRARRALGLMSGLLVASLLWLGWSLRQRALRRKERRRLREAGLEAEAQLYQAREEKLAAEATLLQHRVEQQDQLLKSLQVVAGAYAHNLQNLLLPPGRLVDDCIRQESISSAGRGDDPGQMVRLRELKRLLGQVSERVRQTLQALRRESGQYRPEVLNLEKVSNAVFSTWKDLADQRWHIDLVASGFGEGSCPDSGQWFVRADESHLAQALENLIVNARDAIFDRRGLLLREAQASTGPNQKDAILQASAWRGKIEIGLESTDAGHGPGLFVRDNGQGMTAQTLEQCLSPGFTTRHNNALAHGAGSGMGLGLAFLANMIERMNAKLTIQSEFGKGTKILIRFPVFHKEDGAGVKA